MPYIGYQAKMFAIAAERCNERRSLGPNTCEWLPIPAITCWAFSIELGIKALLAASGKPNTYEHDLGKLFCKLSPDKQGQLRKRWSEISGQPDCGFDSSLKECAEYFLTFRYFHEKIERGEKVKGKISFIKSLSEATLSLLD